VGANDSRPHRSGHPASGQHLLRSEVLAAELVANAGIEPDDLVLEIGAGRGRLTLPLAGAARRVVAVEIDAGFVAALRHMFAGRKHVNVVQADFLRAPFPREPFRAFGNVPFALTTPILKRLLDDPTSVLVRADLILQYEAARKRASVWPGNALSLGWLPWWEFRLARHIYASAFDPRPSVDAGVLAVTRRRQPLLPFDMREDYRAFLRRGFRRANLPVHRTLKGHVAPGVVKRVAREHGIPSWSKVSDLDVFDWVALFSMASESAAR
jgi:23S rRNA (adenine-N6)-dimethyltransferase